MVLKSAVLNCEQVLHQQQEEDQPGLQTAAKVGHHRYHRQDPTVLCPHVKHIGWIFRNTMLLLVGMVCWDVNNSDNISDSHMMS